VSDPEGRGVGSRPVRGVVAVAGDASCGSWPWGIVRRSGGLTSWCRSVDFRRKSLESWERNKEDNH
jgi:hypothetical protein